METELFLPYLKMHTLPWKLFKLTVPRLKCLLIAPSLSETPEEESTAQKAVLLPSDFKEVLI